MLFAQQGRCLSWRLVLAPKKTATKAPADKGSGDREKKILNTMVNSGILIMSSMMGAFGETMVKATWAVASGMVEALEEGQGEKVTEELDADQLAQYTQMLPSGDPKFLEMFNELTGWMNKLPVKDGK